MSSSMNTPLRESLRTGWISSGQWIQKQFNILLLIYITISLTPVGTFLTDAFFPPDVAWPYVLFLWPSYTFLYGYAIVAVLIRDLKRSTKAPFILFLNFALLATTYWILKVTYGIDIAAPLTYTFLNYVSLTCILLRTAEPLLKREMKLDVKISITLAKRQ